MTCPYSDSEKELTAEEKLQAVYDSETHAKIGWFWDGGVDVELYDSKHPLADKYGYYQAKTFRTVKEAVDWLYNETVGKEGG